MPLFLLNKKSLLPKEDLLCLVNLLLLLLEMTALTRSKKVTYTHHTAKRGENGKPITNPPQMLGGPCRTGMTKSAFFHVP